MANAAIACVAAAAFLSAIAIPAGRFADRAPLWSVLDLMAITVALAGAACFIIWVSRARRNLDQLPAANPDWSTSWSTCVWFLPVCNFGMPALVMSDIVNATLAGTDDAARSRLALLAKTWWVTFIVAAFFLYMVIDRWTSASPPRRRRSGGGPHSAVRGGLHRVRPSSEHRAAAAFHHGAVTARSRVRRLPPVRTRPRESGSCRTQ